MASDPGHTWEASTGSIHKPTSGQRLRLVLRSLFLASAKSSGRALSLDSSACLESRAPFVRRCACGVVQRARIRLSRHKHEKEDEHEHEHEHEKNHWHKHRLSDTAVSWTSAYSPSPFPLSGARRYSYAYLGGSRPSMSLERALRESERDEETRDMYWRERGGSAYSNLEQNASRSSMDDEDLGQTLPNSSWINLDSVASSPLVATFIDEYRTTIAHERGGQAKSKSPVDVDEETASGVRKARRETGCVPIRRRSVLQTPGVATRPLPDLTSETKSASWQPSACLASVSVSLSPSPSTKWPMTEKAAESEQEAQQPRDSLCAGKAKEAIPRGSARPPDTGLVSPQSPPDSQARLANADSASSSAALTATLPGPAQRAGVTEASSSAAVDHVTHKTTSVGVAAASTSEALAPSSKPAGRTRQLPLRPRHRVRQDTSPAGPSSRNSRLPFRRPSEAACALTKQASGHVPCDRSPSALENRRNDDPEDLGARRRQRVTDHGSNKDDHVETNARGSRPEASPLASPAQAGRLRGSHPSRPPPQPTPAAVLPRSSSQKCHATTTSEAPRPTSHSKIPETTAPKTDAKPLPRDESRPRRLPNLSKELPPEPVRKTTLRSTFFKRPRRTTTTPPHPSHHPSAPPPPRARLPPPRTSSKSTTTPGPRSPYLHYCASLTSRHQVNPSRHKRPDPPHEQDKRKHSTLLHRPAFSDLEEALAVDGLRGSEPRYRVLHSYNSPAYKNLPIWG
ncbi:hypothetical protein E4U53_003092 [Claviceps sorghi]|nr:hypothetical protein E4U53_003092 [Claviceps sorghi]